MRETTGRLENVVCVKQSEIKDGERQRDSMDIWERVKGIWWQGGGKRESRMTARPALAESSSKYHSG